MQEDLLKQCVELLKEQTLYLRSIDAKYNDLIMQLNVINESIHQIFLK